MNSAFSADGVKATRVGTACDAAEALQKQGFDAVILSHPLPDADVIGSCATLAQVPGAPPIVLLDVIDATAAIESTVPKEMRPKRILKKPIDTAKLAGLVHELIDAPEDGMLRSEPGFDRLAQLLVQLNRSGKTGSLEVRADGVVTRVHFQNGLPVGAEGGSLRETLGRTLLRQGTLSEDDYVRVIERMTEQVFENEHLRMGEVLVELGLLSGEQVHAALSEQVAEKVAACFQWRGASFEFEEMDEPPSGMEGFDIPPIETLVLRGLKLYVPADELEAHLRPDRLKTIRLTRPPVEVMARFEIEPGQQRTLAQLDGKRTLGATLQAGIPAQLVAALVWTGSAEFIDRARPAPDTRRGRPEFAREVVMPRKKGASKARPKKPEKEPESTEASHDDSKAKLEAEQLFRRAQSQLSAERFAEAVKTMAKVVRLQPNEPEYRMIEAWAVYLHIRVEARVARAKAVACARRMTEADPQAAKPHAILGRLAMDDGDDALADRELQAAMVRDPHDEDVQRGIKRLRGPGQPAGSRAED